MEQRYDVIISGAGPSGSLLGYLLSRKGINTLIIEKQDFPRYKICAGGLQHRTLGLIPFDIQNVIQRSLHGILFTYRGKDSFLKKYESPVIHTIDRREFDAYLARKAEESGCTVRFGEELTGYERCGDGLKIKTDKNIFRSRILAGADGVRGAVHRRLISGRKMLKIIGYEVEKEAVQEEKDKYIDAAGLDFGGVERGYVWAFPRKDMISYGIGGPFNSAGSMKKYFNEYMANNAAEKKIKILAQSIPVRTENTPLSSSRVLVVGDAACLADGFTGEGLYNALRSSHLASKSIINAFKSSDYDLKDYFGTVQEEIYRDIKISLNFSRIFFTYPLFFYKLMKTNEKFFRLCCRVLRGEIGYSDISGRLSIFRR